MKSGYIIVESQDDKQIIVGYAKTLKEAQRESRDNQEIYEISGFWASRPAMELDKKDLEELFG